MKLKSKKPLKRLKNDDCELSRIGRAKRNT